MSRQAQLGVASWMLQSRANSSSAELAVESRILYSIIKSGFDAQSGRGKDRQGLCERRRRRRRRHVFNTRNRTARLGFICLTILSSRAIIKPNEEFKTLFFLLLWKIIQLQDKEKKKKGLLQLITSVLTQKSFFIQEHTEETGCFDTDTYKPEETRDCVSVL